MIFNVVDVDDTGYDIDDDDDNKIFIVCILLESTSFTLIIKLYMYVYICRWADEFEFSRLFLGILRNE